jgi:hypothetical protein
MGIADELVWSPDGQGLIYQVVMGGRVLELRYLSLADGKAYRLAGKLEGRISGVVPSL